MRKCISAKSILVMLFFFSLAFSAASLASRSGRQQEAPQDFELVKTILVVASTAWTNTALDVKKGQEYYFEATGTASLQKDNPVATCGPEGLNLRTMQQPLPDQNLGALLCKIREKTDVTEDKQTGEKTSRDFGEILFIGKSNRIIVFSSGRLMLGLNENVTGDNEGGFEVKIYLRRIADP